MKTTLYGMNRCWHNVLRAFVIGLIVFCMHAAAFAQKDSLTIYHKLEKQADKHKVTGWIFDAIFVDPDDVRSEEDTIIKHQSNRKLKVTNVFLSYANKPIRSITVEVLDPFGYSVNDTFKYPTKGIQRLGNRYHITTRRKVIRNLVLFEEGDLADPIKLSESERLLRQAPYVNDARIYVYQLSGKKRKGQRQRAVLNDSLDIVIRVHDKWSLEPGSNFDINNPNLSITENNFAGVGHQFREEFKYNVAENRPANSGRYGIYNIKNTYISSALSYYYDNLLTNFTLSLDRPFYSPLTKYAGGITLSKSYAHFLYIDSMQSKEYQLPLDFSLVDVWTGRNFRVGNKRKLRDRVSNIFTGIRYVHTQYQRRPGPEFDSNRTLLDQSLYLVNVGYSNTKFYKDRYISRFGANEDIPLGFSVQLIAGYRQLEQEPDRFYSGISVSSSTLFSRLYLQTTLAYGSFHNRYSTQKGVASIELFGFSNLMQFGRWYFRQFGRIKYVEGINRSPEETITLNSSEMYGFSSDQLLGKSKAFVNLQTIIYTPYNVFGFRFAPVIMFGFGQVGNTISDVFTTKVHQAYSFGLLIRNENLLFNTFQVTLGLYPYMPGTNATGISGSIDSGRRTPFNNVSIGKPDVLPYY